MKKLIIIVILALGVLVSAGGCIPTTAQIQTATNKTDTLMVVVDKLQETFDVLVEDGVIKSEKLEAISEEIDKAQIDIVVINEAVKEKADEGFVEQLIATNQASAPINPYAPMIDAALNFLLAISTPTAVGGVYLAKRNASKAKEAETKNIGLEKGLSRVKGEAEPELAKKIHDTMKIYTG